MYHLLSEVLYVNLKSKNGSLVNKIQCCFYSLKIGMFVYVFDNVFKTV